MKMLYRLLGPMLLLAVCAGALATDKPNDARALQGIEKGKVVFDINMENPKKMTLYLAVIRETVDDLHRQGVKPDVILAFRGKSVLLVAQDTERFELTDEEHLEKIAAQLADLQGQGVRMEACSVATRLFGVDNATLLDGVQPVGNTFVSLTGYHAQGYASIPIY